jgi:glycosyltransferase involved in cell wall biosynthesis
MLAPGRRTTGAARSASVGAGLNADRRRIALIASHAPSLPLFRGELIRTLVQNGHTVLCLAPEFEPALVSELGRLGAVCQSYPLDRTGMDIRADIRSLRSLTDVLRQWHPDIVCGYTPKPAIYGSLAAHRAGIARIVPMITGLGYAFTGNPSLKSKLVQHASLVLYARALARSHGVIFHNADDRALLLQAGALPSALPSFVVGGSGVDLDRFQARPFPDSDTQFGSGLVFLMMARLVKYKGVLEFCDAARMLRQRGAKARFVLAGPAESGPAGVPIAHIEAYADAVDYVGPQNNVPALLASCHVYVLPSHGEGLPRSVLEAMAIGRPIITTTARGCRDTVQPGINGVTVPVGDTKALADAMQAMVARPDLLPAMAAASRRIVSERFDVRLVIQQMLTAFGLAP